MAYRNRGFFKENEDIGPTLYKNFRLNTCRNLGVFLKNHGLFAYQNLGISEKNYIVSRFVKQLSKSWACHKNHVSWRGLFFSKIFKKTKILGLHFIKMSSKTPVKILGYFIRTMFFDAKNPWPTFACQNVGLFEECKDIAPTLYQNSRINNCRNLGVFLKNQVFDTKNILFVWLIKIFFFFFFLKRTKILGLHCIKISGKTPVKILVV